ncbi:MAG TPA: sialidase family protein, partial [Lacipirellula sp.]
MSRLNQLAVFCLNAILLAAPAHGRAQPLLPRIQWNPASLSLIQANGMYARMIRLDDGRIICGFDVRGEIGVRHSSDGGRSWRELVAVAQWKHGRLTNAELLQLQSGSLLCMFNERPRRSAAAGGIPFSISISRSGDRGKTWQKPERLYSAGAEFNNGCWEPAAIQLPSGEIQLFFSNEGPYRESDEQEITLLRSADDGRTWSKPETISFRPRARDGMPVPLVLNDCKGMALAIEDNGLRGNFKPVIVFSTIEDNWRSGVRTPESPDRWGALKNLPPPQVAASAPYLRQMPSGETVLSYQQSDSGELEDAFMMVSI